MDRLDPDYIDAIRFLYERINYEKSIDRPYDQQTYRLARMEFLLQQLGSPHVAAPVVHIAGTKGKGSVSWLIAETLRRSGLRVGLYTSPHLLHLEERFLVDGQPCLPDELAMHIESLKKAEKATSQSSLGEPTFFEMTTALAWTLFTARKTDINVIEVGLGGRLDSTNVCSSALDIITSISFDHQQQLGNTISLIATEKAGIIKSGNPVISGARHPEARTVIRNRCATTQSQLWEIDTDFQAVIRSQQLLDSAPPGSESPPASYVDFLPKNAALPLTTLSNIAIGMPGRHQAENAAVAIAAWHRLNHDGWKLPAAALLDSIRETKLSCRIELVGQSPTTVVDTAHNVASMDALLEALQDHFAPTRRTIIFACSKDKEYEKMLQQILGYTDRLIVTQFQINPRAVLVEQLEKLSKENTFNARSVEVLSAPSVQQALEFAIATAKEGELICITGSFFLAAEAKTLLEKSV